MVRAFLALELSEGIRSALAGAQDVLRRCSARLTFVAPAQIHVTVKFLGEVDDKKIPALIDAVKTVPGSPFPVRAGRITVNNPRRPFTVWSVVDDGGQGAALRDRIESALAPVGFPREARPFTAHATVARVKRFDPSLAEVLRELGSRNYGECTVTGFRLKKSTLTPSGPVYEDLLEVRW
ncbi:MAG TPA: RNA 2',3'-cyclic phosphodiesterase [Methanoregulaceae archaeon]|nr:RNA 2',3'-cyclic phosphodiesterase [Methanoregulaceae archaeon]HRY75079.1 RNA 2',3'-cyclic phosphodiesterase [Methanoregulaceae archaeon]